MKKENFKAVKLPEVISKSFKKLIASASLNDAAALRKEIYFSNKENQVADFENIDPLGEVNYHITPNSIHQYPNRILILTTGRCIAYCRYCFRREFTARKQGFITDKELDVILNYINTHTEINEILLSGGDPLSANFETLEKAILKIRNTNKDILIRLCTRAIIFAPELFTSKLIKLLHSCKPLWIIPHINHPAELGKEQIIAINSCINAGISMQSQTVLLKGINDNADTLALLFRKLIVLGVKPGYLFQLDTAKGTSHFAVPLQKSISIWKELLSKVSGISRPEFAVDLEDGGGKFSLSAIAFYDSILHITNEGFSIKKSDGKVYSYKDN